MKLLSILIFIVSIFITGCSEKKTDAGSTNETLSSNQQKDLTGTFTANGKTYSGKVTTQLFVATGQYSVLCQDNSDPNNSKLIQFIFKDETSVRAAKNLNAAYNQGVDQNAAETSLSFDIRYQSYEDSKGTVVINKSGSGNEIVFNDVTLKTISKESIVVSGKIPF